MQPLDVFDLDVFAQTSSYYESRLSAPGATPHTRGLDRAAVEQLIDLVERDYIQTVDTDRHMHRAVQLGLLEAGTDPETHRPRYFVSHILRPLLRLLLTDDEYAAACAAARSLYSLWITGPTEPALTA